MTNSLARRRYNHRVLILSIGYAACLLGAVYLFKHRLVAGPAAYAVAILPALPIIAIFAALGRYLVDEQDEYVRMLMIRQILFGSAFALSVATAWGFLESFGLVGHVESYAVAILYFGGLGIGALANRLSGRAGA